MRTAIIHSIDYVLPEQRLTNAQLAREFPDWPADKIYDKLGIRERRIATGNECASDLATAAAEHLLHRVGTAAEDISFLLVCTQSPDYILPSTACLIASRLGLRSSCGALDITLGCSGYVYGLGIAKGVVETRQADTVLFLTADTYSRFLHPLDKSTRTLFGDAASATLIVASDAAKESIGPFIYGTDGHGGKHLILEAGGCRTPSVTTEVDWDSNMNLRSQGHLHMDGPELFAFTSKTVPQAVADLLHICREHKDAVDLFVFHQANKFLLEHLRQKCGIPPSKFVVAMELTGNTVSSTIPIALRTAELDGALRPNSRIMVVGFGVGFSWAAAMVTWHGGHP